MQHRKAPQKTPQPPGEQITWQGPLHNRLCEDHRPSPGRQPQPPFCQLQDHCPMELIHDRPILGSDLSWPGTPALVVGGLSALQIGPAARNQLGGREAAQRICRTVLNR
jgi:hypothetical protein